MKTVYFEWESLQYPLCKTRTSAYSQKPFPLGIFHNLLVYVCSLNVYYAVSRIIKPKNYLQNKENTVILLCCDNYKGYTTEKIYYRPFFVKPVGDERLHVFSCLCIFVEDLLLYFPSRPTYGSLQ